ncbi:hypothetical protein H8356DRAFT_1339521 [Neocallimastix lanati (nom. inval.)]|nr:hypothetical protein H8356DRAFT_1339521 [Neocallimastix sp. JGI-2020a]
MRELLEFEYMISCVHEDIFYEIEIFQMFMHLSRKLGTGETTPSKRVLEDSHMAVQQGHFCLYGSIMITSIFP